MTLRTPQEVLATLSPEKETIFQAAMEVIIYGIEDRFTGDPVKIFLYFAEEDIKVIKTKITKTLAEKGWNITFCPIQRERDGDITPVLISAL